MNGLETKDEMVKLADEYYAEYSQMTGEDFASWFIGEKRHHAIEEIEGWLKAYTPLEESGRKLMARDMYQDLSLRR